MERRALEYKIRVKNEFFLKNKLYDICKNENKKHVSLKQDKTNFPQPITQLQNQNISSALVSLPCAHPLVYLIAFPQGKHSPTFHVFHFLFKTKILLSNTGDKNILFH